MTKEQGKYVTRKTEAGAPYTIAAGNELPEEEREKLDRAHQRSRWVYWGESTANGEGIGHPGT